MQLLPLLRLGVQIGAGRVSAVYHTQHKFTGMDIALKCYLHDKVDPLTLSQIRREIDIHAAVSHPAITNYYGSFEVGRCTLTPPDPLLPIAERRLVSTLEPIK